MTYRIDGKPVKKFLWMREQRILLRGGIQNFAVEVHAFDKDHSLQRLVDKYGEDLKRQWEFVAELQDEETAGMLAHHLPLLPC